MATKGDEAMTLDGDKGQLDIYVRHMADLMGLRDWTIRVDVEDVVYATNHRSSREGEGRCEAAARILHGRQFAILSFDSSWPEWDADTLRQTVTHELIHAHTAKMLYAFHNVGNVVSGGVLFDVLDTAFDDAHELTVDAIAVAWAESLPLPLKDEEQHDH